MKNAYVETLDKAYVKLSDRQTNYGPEAARFERLSKIASIMLNKPISMYDAAIILHCDRMARLQENRCDNDSYVDGINYLALASEFASDQFSVVTAVEDDMKAKAAGIQPGSVTRIDPEAMKELAHQPHAHPYVEALNETEQAMRRTGHDPSDPQN